MLAKFLKIKFIDQVRKISCTIIAFDGDFSHWLFPSSVSYFDWYERKEDSFLAFLPESELCQHSPNPTEPHRTQRSERWLFCWNRAPAGSSTSSFEHQSDFYIVGVVVGWSVSRWLSDQCLSLPILSLQHSIRKCRWTLLSPLDSLHLSLSGFVAVR